MASPLLPEAVRGTTNHALLHVSDWYATFAVLAGLNPADDCLGCVPIDGLFVWPVITGSGPPPRTELVLGVGGPSQTGGALRNGSYKLIDRGGNSKAADGWSAQYPGTTQAIAGDHPCVSKPCLFNLDVDPRETHDLSEEEPHLAAAMLARYKHLAKALYAPNGNLLDEEATAWLMEQCHTDNCWDRATEAAAIRGENIIRQHQHQHDASPIFTSCHLNGLFYDGEDVFDFVTAEGHVTMTIASGCDGCAFTHASGELAGDKVSVIASGKGSWVLHTGVLDSAACRVHWTAHNSTGIGAWADFCYAKPCIGPAPPGPEGTACDKMKTSGYWQPWM